MSLTVKGRLQHVIYWTGKTRLPGSSWLILWPSLAQQNGEVTWAFLRKESTHERIFFLPFQKTRLIAVFNKLFIQMLFYSQEWGCLEWKRWETQKTYVKCPDICLAAFTTYNECSRHYWDPQLDSILQPISLLKSRLRGFSPHLKSPTNDVF